MEEFNTEENGDTEIGARDCIGELLSGSTVDAKEAEFKKEAEARLTKLAGSVDVEDGTYRGRRGGFVEVWRDLAKKIADLKKHFEQCYDVQCFIEKVICKEIICREWELRRKLLMEKLCGRYSALYLANEVFAEAASQLDAWEKVSTWLEARQKANEELYDKICKLDSCEDRYFAIYLLYFELGPAHDAMGPPPDYPMKIDPAEKYCTGTCGDPPPKGSGDLCGYPWLIDPDEYNCILAKVWTAWRDAGIAQVKAQCDVDEIEKCRKQYEELATNEARHDAAREAFRRFDPDCCKKNAGHNDRSSDNGVTQQTSYRS